MNSKAKLIKIGNSQGIRIPKAMILRYHLSETLVLEEKSDGIFMRADKTEKLGWEETYQAMADSEPGEWDDWHNLDVDIDAHV